MTDFPRRFCMPLVMAALVVALVLVAGGSALAETASGDSSAGVSRYAAYDPLPSEVTLISGATILGGAGGRLERADLVFLRNNPLQDIAHTLSIEWVMKDGRLFEADTLDEIWPDSLKHPEPWFVNDVPVVRPDAPPTHTVRTPNDH